MNLSTSFAARKIAQGDGEKIEGSPLEKLQNTSYKIQTNHNKEVPCGQV
jgi:hypothetical protein